MTLTRLTPTAVWRISAALVLALDERFGPPVDGYVNGTQVWLTDEGATLGDATLEWRLHPVRSYHAPSGIHHDDLWDEVVALLTAGEAADALPLGGERRSLDSLWDGLECFPGYGAEVEPPVLGGAARDALGIGPDATGLVDHDRIGDTWEKSRGATSIVALLLEELETAGTEHSG